MIEGLLAIALAVAVPLGLRHTARVAGEEPALGDGDPRLRWCRSS
jgi:hypothetical protein